MNAREAQLIQREEELLRRERYIKKREQLVHDISRSSTIGTCSLSMYMPESSNSSCSTASPPSRSRYSSKNRESPRDGTEKLSPVLKDTPYSSAKFTRKRNSGLKPPRRLSNPIYESDENQLPSSSSNGNSSPTYMDY